MYNFALLTIKYSFKKINFFKKSTSTELRSDYALCVCVRAHNNKYIIIITYMQLCCVCNHDSSFKA